MAPRFAASLPTVPRGPSVARPPATPSGPAPGSVFSPGGFTFAPPPGPALTAWSQKNAQPTGPVPMVIGQKLPAIPSTDSRGHPTGGRHGGNVYGEGNVPSQYGFGNSIQVGADRYLLTADPQALKARAFGTPYTPGPTIEQQIAALMARQPPAPVTPPTPTYPGGLPGPGVPGGYAGPVDPNDPRHQPGFDPGGYGSGSGGG